MAILRRSACSETELPVHQGPQEHEGGNSDHESVTSGANCYSCPKLFGFLRCFSYPRWLRVRDSSWRVAIAGGALMALLALVANIVIAAYGAGKPRDELSGDPILAEGDCGQMKRIFLWSHLAINVLSTILLASSNLTMQCLSAPTREELDRVHAKGEWVDVGLSGVTNRGIMSGWRRWLWALLAVTTLPVHLFYNSIIYTSSSANEYIGMLADQSFLQGHEMAYNFTAAGVDPIAAADLRQRAMSGNLARIENAACIDIYSSNLISQYSSVVLISNVTRFPSLVNGSISVAWMEYPTSEQSAADDDDDDYPINELVVGWICNDGGSYNFGDGIADTCITTSGDPSNWIYKICKSANGVSLRDPTAPPPAGWEQFDWNCTNGSTIVQVDYCLVQETQEFCKIQMASAIMILVIVLNGLKLVFFIVAVQWRDFNPMVTLGDALASYLERPDPVTDGLGVVSAFELRDRVKDVAIQRQKVLSHELKVVKNARRGKKTKSDLSNHLSSAVLDRTILPEIHGRRFFFRGASQRRWSITYGLWSLVLLLGFVGIGTYTRGASDSFATLWADGFSGFAPRSYIAATEGEPLIRNVLLSNSPQLLLSMAYFSTNGLVTSVMLSREFGRLGMRYCGLRVSAPRGAQRSTYWLSLPYRYGFPLLFFSAILHWAVSQTLFLDQVNVMAPDGTPDHSRDVSALGWSALAIVIVVVLVVILLILLVCLGLGRFPAHVPLVESNSLAISATCHPLPGNEGAQEAEQKVKYGVLGRDAEGLLRAGLSSERVQPLILGEDYG